MIYFTTLYLFIYSIANSTLLNNYSTIYLVNNKDLLISSTFVLFKNNNIV